MKDSIYYIGICDDEEVFREKILDELKEFSVWNNLHVEFVLFTSGEEVVSSEKRIDLLLLDEELCDDSQTLLNGNDVRRILENRFCKTYIIWVTSYDKYMQDAFGQNVIGFMNKKELGQNDRLETLMVRCMDLIQGASKIVYIESKRNDLELHFFDGTIQLLRGSLEAVAKEIRKHEIYIKCHRSYIVNFNYVKSVVRNFSDFKLLDGTLIPISRGQKAEVQRKYEQFISHKVAILFGE